MKPVSLLTEWPDPVRGRFGLPPLPSPAAPGLAATSLVHPAEGQQGASARARGNTDAGDDGSASSVASGASGVVARDEGADSEGMEHGDASGSENFSEQERATAEVLLGRFLSALTPKGSPIAPLAKRTKGAKGKSAAEASSPAKRTRSAARRQQEAADRSEVHQTHGSSPAGPKDDTDMPVSANSGGGAGNDDSTVPNPTSPRARKKLGEADPRLFAPLLRSVRESDPWLYRAIASHPLVVGKHSRASRKGSSGGAGGHGDLGKPSGDASMDDAEEEPTGSHVDDAETADLEQRVVAEHVAAYVTSATKASGSGGYQAQRLLLASRLLSNLDASDGSLDGIVMASAPALRSLVRRSTPSVVTGGAGDAATGSSSRAEGTDGDDSHPAARARPRVSAVPAFLARPAGFRLSDLDSPAEPVTSAMLESSEDEFDAADFRGGLMMPSLVGADDADYSEDEGTEDEGEEGYLDYHHHHSDDEEEGSHEEATSRRETSRLRLASDEAEGSDAEAATRRSATPEGTGRSHAASAPSPARPDSEDSPPLESTEALIAAATAAANSRGPLSPTTPSAGGGASARRPSRGQARKAVVDPSKFLPFSPVWIMSQPLFTTRVPAHIREEADAEAAEVSETLATDDPAQLGSVSSSAKRAAADESAPGGMLNEQQQLVVWLLSLMDLHATGYLRAAAASDDAAAVPLPRCAVDPHPRLFLLLRSLLVRLLRVLQSQVSPEQCLWAASSATSCLRILAANFAAVRNRGLDSAAMGLAFAPVSRSSRLFVEGGIGGGEEDRSSSVPRAGGDSRPDVARSEMPPPFVLAEAGVSGVGEAARQGGGAGSGAGSGVGGAGHDGAEGVRDSGYVSPAGGQAVFIIRLCAAVQAAIQAPEMIAFSVGNIPEATDETEHLQASTPPNDGSSSKVGGSGSAGATATSSFVSTGDARNALSASAAALRDCALGTWQEGLMLFYPTPARRSALLLSLLRYVSDSATARATWLRQLEALCEAIIKSNAVEVTLPSTLATSKSLTNPARLNAPELRMADVQVLNRLLDHVRQSEARDSASASPWAAALLVRFQDALLRPWWRVHASLARSRDDSGSGELRLTFDSARCAESIRVNGAPRENQVTQTVDKVWGMVMGAQGFEPHTGTHRWDIHLLRCEKGHVFVGAATREASTSTYLGGDRHGWGLIGTRALWHGRSKQRGGYGNEFRTGSVLRITLDTNSGTLSYGNANTGAAWGVAFRDMTSTTTLYPAVGMYQRNDEVKITYVPPDADGGDSDDAAWAQELSRAAAWNRAASCPPPLLLSYAQMLLKRCFEEGPGTVSSRLATSYLTKELLPRLVTTLSEWKERHFRAAECLLLLPHLASLIKTTDKIVGRDVTSGFPEGDVTGQWCLESSQTEDIPAQTYYMQLHQSEDGTVIGVGGTKIKDMFRPHKVRPEGEAAATLAVTPDHAADASAADASSAAVVGEGKLLLEESLATTSVPTFVARGRLVGNQLKFSEMWTGVTGSTCEVSVQLSCDGQWLTGMFTTVEAAGRPSKNTSASITAYRIVPMLDSPSGILQRRATEAAGSENAPRPNGAVAFSDAKPTAPRSSSELPSGNRLLCVLLRHAVQLASKCLSIVVGGGGGDVIVASVITMAGPEKRASGGASAPPDADDMDVDASSPMGATPVLADLSVADMLALDSDVRKRLCEPQPDDDGVPPPSDDEFGRLSKFDTPDSTAGVAETAASGAQESKDDGDVSEREKLFTELQAAETQRWQSSPLFAGGASSTVLHAYVPQIVRALSRSCVSPEDGSTPDPLASGEPTSSVALSCLQHLGVQPSAAAASEMPADDNMESAALISAMASGGDAAASQLDSCVSRVAGFAKMTMRQAAKRSGSPVNSARLATIAALLHHTGRARFAVDLAQRLSGDRGQAADVSQELRDVWRQGELAVSKACDSLANKFPGNRRQANHAAAAIVQARARFLLSLQPAATCRKVQSESLVREVCKFLSPTSISLQAARTLLVMASVRACLRTAGLGFLAELLQESHVKTAEFRTQLVSALLSIERDGGEDGTSEVSWPATPGAGSLQAEPVSFVFSGVECAGVALTDVLYKVFWKLYDTVARELLRSASPSQSDGRQRLLPLVRSFGMLQSSADLERLVDLGVPQAVHSMFQKLYTARPRGRSSRSLHDEVVVSTCLHVFHLLSLQIALASARVEGGSASGIRVSEAMMLLLDIVFDELNTGASQLHRLATESRIRQLTVAPEAAATEPTGSKTVPSAGSVPRSGQSAPTRGSSTAAAMERDPSSVSSSAFADVEDRCYPFVSMLYTLSAARLCRDAVAKPAWLRMLLSLIQLGSVRMQRRLMRLLRRLLPRMSPMELSVDVEGVCESPAWNAIVPLSTSESDRLIAEQNGGSESVIDVRRAESAPGTVVAASARGGAGAAMSTEHVPAPSATAQGAAHRFVQHLLDVGAFMHTTYMSVPPPPAETAATGDDADGDTLASALPGAAADAPMEDDGAADDSDEDAMLDFALKLSMQDGDDSADKDEAPQRDADADDADAAAAEPEADDAKPSATAGETMSALAEAARVVERNCVGVDTAASTRHVALATEAVMLLRLLCGVDAWRAVVVEVLQVALTGLGDTLRTFSTQLVEANTHNEDVAVLGGTPAESALAGRVHRVAASERALKVRSRARGLAALCTMGGLVDFLRIGGVARLIGSDSVSTRSKSSRKLLARAARRAATATTSGPSGAASMSGDVSIDDEIPDGCGVVVAYSPTEPVAELAVREQSDSGEERQRIERVAVDELRASVEIEADAEWFPKSLADSLLLDVVANLASDAASNDLCSAITQDSKPLAPRSAAASESKAETTVAESKVDPHGGSSEEKDAAGGDAESLDAADANASADLERASELDRAVLRVHAFKALFPILQNRRSAEAFLRGVVGGDAAQKQRHGRLLRSLIKVATISTPSLGLSDLQEMEESWMLLWSTWHASLAEDRTTMLATALRLMKTAVTPAAPDEPDDADAPAEAAEDDASAGASGAAATVSAAEAEDSGPSENARRIMDMGFAREWAELALRRTGDNLDAAIAFVVDNMDTLDAMVTAEAAERSSRAASSGGERSAARSERQAVIGQIVANFGFPPRWAQRAVEEVGPSYVAAAQWAVENSGRLGAEDDAKAVAAVRAATRRAAESGSPSTRSGATGAAKEESKELEPDERGVRALVCVSGHAVVDSKLRVTGVSGAQFTSVGTRGVLLVRGKWYYEVVLGTSGCMQIGWADGSYVGESEQGNGVGDDRHSWAYDGYRRFRWHEISTPWGLRWKAGDVVQCCIDMEARTMDFGLNGRFEAPMGRAFSGFACDRGVYPCASFNNAERLQFNFGGAGRPFRYDLPAGYAPMHDAFTACSAPSPGLPNPRGFSSLTADALGEVDDRLEEDTNDAPAVERFFPPQVSGVGISRSGGRGSRIPRRAGEAEDERLGVQTSRTSFAGQQVSSRAELASELAFASTAELHKYVLNTAQMLAVLHARRAVLALLSRWPTHAVGPMTLESLGLSDDPAVYGDDVDMDDCADAEDGVVESGLSQLLKFIKLVSWRRLGVSPEDCERLALGRSPYSVAWASRLMLYPVHPLDLLTPAVRDAVLAATLRSDHTLTEGVVRYIEDEILLAAHRDYGMVAWRGTDGDPSNDGVPVGLIDLTDAGLWTDAEAETQPNIELDVWLTGLAMEAALLPRRRGAPMRFATGISLFNAWCVALRSPNVGLKERACRVLASILQEVISDLKTFGGAAGATARDPEEAAAKDDEGAPTTHAERLRAFMNCLPRERLQQAALNRMEFERAESPVFSRYLQGLVELTAVLRIAHALTPAVSEAEKAAAALVKAVGDVEIEAEGSSSSREAAGGAGGAGRGAGSSAVAASGDGSKHDRLEHKARPWMRLFECRDAGPEPLIAGDMGGAMWTGPLRQEPAVIDGVETIEVPPMQTGRKVVRGPAWESRYNAADSADGAVGTVIAVVNHRGNIKRHVKVRWPNGNVATYRWGADGKWDVLMVEVDDDDNVVTTYDPPDDISPAVASRMVSASGDLPKVKFGKSLDLGVVLRLAPVGDEDSDEENDEAEAAAGGVDAGIPAFIARTEMGAAAPVVPVVAAPSPKRESKRNRPRLRSWADIAAAPPRPRTASDASDSTAPSIGSGMLRSLTSPTGDAAVPLMSLGAPATVPEPPPMAPGGVSLLGLSRKTKVAGVIEWPDFHAVVGVDGILYSSPSGSPAPVLVITERELLSGLAETGWVPLHGEDAWRPGLTLTMKAKPVSPLSPMRSPARSARSRSRGASLDMDPLSLSPALLPTRRASRSRSLSIADGRDITPVEWPAKWTGQYAWTRTVDGKETAVKGTCVLDGDLLFRMDPKMHGIRAEVKNDGREVTGRSSSGGGGEMAMALADVGFSSGVHYWEVSVDQVDMQSGTVMVGVAEKPADAMQCNRWRGWSFVSFRATCHDMHEAVYGDFFNNGDVVGVRLDCERGVLSFFLDGAKFGQHVVVDLGQAFPGLRGDGGGLRRPRTLYPCVGIKRTSDKVTLLPKYLTQPCPPLRLLLDEAHALTVALDAWGMPMRTERRSTGVPSAGADAAAFASGSGVVPTPGSPKELAHAASSNSGCGRWNRLGRDALAAFASEAWRQWQRWRTGEHRRHLSRAGVVVEVDTSAAAAARIGSPFRAGDRVRVSVRSGGHRLDVPEVALVLGVYKDRLWYRADHVDGNDGMGAAALAWYWTPAEVATLELADSTVADTGAAAPSGGGAGAGVLGSPARGGLTVDVEYLSDDDAAIGVASEFDGDFFDWGETRRDFHRLAGVDLPSHDATSPRSPMSPDSSVKPLPTLQEWTADDDLALVALVNAACSHFAVEPASLRRADLLVVHHKARTAAAAAHSGDAAVDAADAARWGATTWRPDSPLFSAARTGARFCVLRRLNQVAQRVLPLININAGDEPRVHGIADGGIIRVQDDAVQAAASGAESPTPSGSPSPFGARDVLGRFVDDGSAGWQPATLGKLLHSRRWLLFTATKRAVWSAVVKATTTATPLAHDEYEDPREIRTVRLNRGPRTQPAALARLPTPDARLRRSLLGQLYGEVRSWPAAAFRRSYVGKGHGGQERAFKVKFLGEGVNDYGGPYRAVFEQVADELQFDRFDGGGPQAVPKPPDGAMSLLPILVPCPARQSNAEGSGADRFVLNPSEDMTSPAALDVFSFVGTLWAVAVRHHLTMPLALPDLVWRPLAGETVTPEDLFGINPSARTSLAHSRPPPTHELDSTRFVVQMSDGSVAELLEGGDEAPVSPQSWPHWRRLAMWRHLTESEVALRALREGIRAVLPAELMPLFSPAELSALFCGTDDVDVDQLKAGTKYGSGVTATSQQVLWLWEVLREAGPTDRAAFLRFACARSRLPSGATASASSKTLQIDLPTGSAREAPDKWLPSSLTCFSQLALPAYTSKEVLREKLWHAVFHSPNMDADVRLHGAAEGWADM